jgi:hypothetical protein
MTTLRQTRNWLLAAFVALWGGMAWAAGGAEEELSPERQTLDAVQRVIESQLIAFQKGDGEGAFFHAAPSIRGMFGSSTTFMDMVERGYNVIYTNARWEFEDSRINGGNAAQIVLVEDGQGRQMRAVYFLGLSNGMWKITGVQRMEGPGTDA